MKTGQLMLDVASFELTSEEREILDHPFVGGLILFTRNFHDIEQLQALTKSIRQAARNPILIAVDHEGGRVQRFRKGFSPIPAMGAFEQTQDPAIANEHARQMGWLMASEVRAIDIDVSFAPVLDLNGVSEVIGQRAFSGDPDKVVELATAFIDGMNQAGMKATGKHFPGHGSVKEDSHIAMPIDRRSKADIEIDLSVFKRIIATGKLDGMMPAHVIYSAYDQQPAGFSPFWLKEVLRQNLAFNGVIFSDDLSMQGADFAGGYTDKARAALTAGCDMILACNQPKGAVEILDDYQSLNEINPSQRVLTMLSAQPITFKQLQQDPRWQLCQTILEQYA